MQAMVTRLLTCIGLLLLANAAWADDQSGDQAVRRGAYLATAGDCTACHGTPEHGPFSGGLPMNSPFGTIYASNITPDPELGIGRDSFADFDNAMRKGIGKDGRHLYPAMPYASLAALSDRDLHDLYAYFMHGVAPVAYQPPATKLPFPFNQRWVLAIWNQVFARHERYVADASRDARWNRGAYLVQGLGHCGACHTPRGLGYEERGYDETAPHYLAGSAVNDGWAAANLNGAAASGLGRWSEDDIVAFLKTGHGGGAVAFGSMTEAVTKSTQYLTEDDLSAMAHYLKSLPVRTDDARYAPLQADIANRGRAEAIGAHELPGGGLFASACAGCHGRSGSGRVPRYPALAGDPVVMTQDPTSLIRIVLEGASAPRTDTGPDPARMPAFGQLTDREIAEVITYIRTSWGNTASPVTDRQVAYVRAKVEAAKRKAATEPNAPPQ